jgi:hypothetical protein
LVASSQFAVLSGALGAKSLWSNASTVNAEYARMSSITVQNVGSSTGSSRYIRPRRPAISTGSSIAVGWLSGVYGPFNRTWMISWLVSPAPIWHPEPVPFAYRMFNGASNGNASSIHSHSKLEMDVGGNGSGWSIICPYPDPSAGGV